MKPIDRITILEDALNDNCPNLIPHEDMNGIFFRCKFYDFLNGGDACTYDDWNKCPLRGK